MDVASHSNRKEYFFHSYKEEKCKVYAKKLTFNPPLYQLAFSASKVPRLKRRAVLSKMKQFNQEMRDSIVDNEEEEEEEEREGEEEQEKEKEEYVDWESKTRDENSVNSSFYCLCIF